MPRGNDKRDYYEVLNVSRTATDDELKKAYRRSALEWHPDRNPERTEEAEERFKELTEAYSVLIDPQKRAAYNHYGHAGVSSQPFAGFDDSIFADFADIFGGFFGLDELFGQQARGRRTRVTRGRDLRYDLDLSFEEAAHGVERKIKVSRRETCPECSGSGARKGTEPTTCSACHGQGSLRYQQGFFAVSRTCPQCRGEGKVIRDPCPECRGEGQVVRERSIQLKVPAGVDNATRLRIGGEGEPGLRGGPPGDLYVILKVAEHPVFERRDANLYCSVSLSFPQAVLGAEVRVPMLDGHRESVKVPAGTQSGAIFRLKGKGLPVLNGAGRGDLYVEIRVHIPKKLTPQQRRLIEELAKTLPAEGRPAEKSGLFEKVKEIFG